ncbi:MAG TPA: hypothetical protein VNM92_05520 [Thermoanaerobaculia bacterium]|nr:hypothetical protein [Thermoanaerobaculia bacterium]
MKQNLLIALILLMGHPFAGLAQTDPQEPPSPRLERAPLGGSIMTPLPSAREKQLKKYEIPELAGTRHVTGSQAVDGKLPQAIVDYTVRYPGVLQRITIFARGLVAIRVEGKEGTIQKRVILPDDAFESYIRNLDSALLKSVAGQSLTGSSPGTAMIRIRDTSGAVSQRSFDPAIILPVELERQRALLQDLFRAISEDRDVTNPMTRYVPKVGDRLVADDKKSYEVSRLLNGGEIVELIGIGQPTRMYVTVQDIHNLFIGGRGERVARD